LRVAHFFGMHALQVLPFVGYLLSTRRSESLTSNATRWAQAAGAVYALLALLLFLWAMAGRPVISL
jgi:protein-S-isoprenylcysteine O-methyltransferase Ste14